MEQDRRAQQDWRQGNGVQFYKIDKTAFIEACKPLQEEFCAKSEDNARYFAEFQSYLDK